MTHTANGNRIGPRNCSKRIMWSLGEERDYGFDENGHEQRERCTAIGECPECSREIAITDETNEWTVGEDGRWYHLRYSGCAEGVCTDCKMLLVDGLYEAKCFDLSRST